MEADSEDAKKRYEQALSERRIETSQNPDGTANLFAYNLEPHVVAGIAGMLHESAKSLRSEDEPRSMDQLRADVFTDVMATNGNRDIAGASVMFTVDANGAEIAGLGPVVPDVVRRVLGDCDDVEHDYVMIDDSGEVTGSGILRRRPGRSQRRRVLARNRTCAAPGCRMPTRNCDIDHSIAYTDGGPTTDCNLVPLCRYHHRAKHLAPWLVEKLPDGTVRWTSKHGHIYVTSGRSP